MTKMFAAAALSVFALAMTAPAFATDKNCKNCVAPRPHYDSQEVVRTSKDVDKSRVINTQSVVEVPSGQVRTRNHPPEHHSPRGVIRHNHTIIEKEVRYKPRPSVHVPRVYASPVVVNFVTQQYYTVRRPALVEAPTVYPRCRSCRVLRVRG